MAALQLTDQHQAIIAALRVNGVNTSAALLAGIVGQDRQVVQATLNYLLELGILTARVITGAQYGSALDVDEERLAALTA